MTGKLRHTTPATEEHKTFPTLREIYNGFAKTYDRNRGRFDMTQVFDDFYARLEPGGGQLLDLGCGAGEPFARYFIERGWSVTGVDVSEGMLELAARYVPQMQRIHADMREVEFPAARFEAITAIYSLFHVPNRDHAKLFDSFRYWLKPHGKALFTYATQDFTGSIEFDGYREFMGQQLYYSHTSPERLFAELKRRGLEIEAADYRDIGNETFLWVTVTNPDTAAS